MKPVVVRNIPRADADSVQDPRRRWASPPHMRRYGRSGLMKPYMRPIWSGASICGHRRDGCMAQPGDNWMIHAAIEQCKPGDVLVVGCTADNTDGMFGDLLATSAEARGGVRASSSMPVAATLRLLKEMGFPVWSQGDLGQGHGEGNARCGEHPGRLCRRERHPRRCDRRRR